MFRVLLVLLIVAGLVGGVTVARADSPIARVAVTYADYSTQAEAQRAADTQDADGDGIYCESLPCPCGTGSTDPTPEPEPAEP